MLPDEQDSSAVRLLSAGIQAARNGENSLAQRLLLQVIEQDERNEKAWLWLSGVVDTNEERLICLENVLAINPDNLPAKKGVAKIKNGTLTADPPPPPAMPPTKTADSIDKVIRVERPPISPAAAVLYPERQVMELPVEEDTGLQTIPAVSYESHTSYHDIWEEETEICAYCAYEVDYDDKQCPQCKRKLTSSHFRYPNASADLIVYFVLFIGTAQLFFIQALVDLIIQAPLISVVWNIFLFLVLFALSGAIFFRQFWAYTASIIILILIFLSMILDVTTGLAEVDLVAMQDGVAYFQAMADSPFITFISPILDYLVPFQMLAIFLALVYGIFMAGPDFERVKTRLIAQVDKGLKDASAFYSAGKAYAKEEMWASAVLHFQRAAAHEPNRAYYHLATGKAFARLGFKARARDAFTSAQRLATNDALQTEIELFIASVNK